MLFDTVANLQRTTFLTLGPLRYFFGEVLDNEDNLQIGRIRCKITNLLEFDSPPQYPWIYPAHEMGLRSPHPGTYLRIPMVGSHIMCIFPHNSIYFGFYLSQ